ncbi:MAG TPA: YhbY family RNA-binding protein [Rhodocyclaceae bacterium]|nr:YhbY family RNA-binding protein [Rhodocyclaceae bacterium]
MNSQNPSLTPAQRSALRARAHGLSPVVSIAQKGLTETVLAEIDRSLSSHELVKIRVFDVERPDREALLAEICAKLGAAPVQHIGKLLVVWREKPEAAATAAKPAPRRRAAARLTKKAAAAKTERSAKATPRRRTR